MTGLPFPGMDPYLEIPGIWESLHHSMIVYTAAALNRVLPSPYVAVVEEWLHILPQRQGIRPDVAIDVASVDLRDRGAVATLQKPIEADAPIVVEALEDEPHHRFVNIIHSHDDGAVLATIEFISHANKSPGRDRDAYLRKQQAICSSSTHLIEIDLLRAGIPTLSVPLERVGDKAYDYLACLHRGGTGSRYELWPVTVRQPLPRILVPLEPDVPDVTLDIQAVLGRAYEEGAFSRMIDYRVEPNLPMRSEDAIWMNDVLIEHGLR